MSTSKSRNRSQSQSSGSSFLAPFQVPFLQSLQGQASQLATQNAAPAQQFASNLTFNELLPQARQFLGGLQDTASGRFGQGLQQSIRGLQDFAGSSEVSDALLQQNPGLPGSLDALSQAIQNNLQATTGTIAGQAGLQGAFGGSRQALATGLAAEEANRNFAQGASQLISQDFAGRQALAPQIMQQQVQALQGAGQLGLGANQLQAQAQLGGVPALQGGLQLGMAPFSAGFGPLLQAAGIIQPITLSQQQSTSRGKGDAFSVGLPEFGG